MRNIFLWVWIGFCAVSMLSAQGDPGGETRKARGRLAWFVYTSVPEGLENPIKVMSGQDVVEVTLSKRSPSEPVKIPKDGILRLVRKVENPKDPDKPAYLTLAQAQVPEGVGKALIILMPVAENPQGLLFQAKVQDLAVFRGGDSLYLNMTNLKVAVDLGKTTLEVDPGEITIYDAPQTSEPVLTPLRYRYFNQEKNKWKMLSASTIVLYAERREICIFSWDPRFNRMDYHGITIPGI